MPYVSCDQIVRSRGFGTFEEHIVIWIRTGMDLVQGMDNVPRFPNGQKRLPDNFRIAFEPRPAEHFFVFGQDRFGQAEPELSRQSHHQC